MKLSTCVLVLLFSSLALCEQKACPDMPVMENFDFSLFLGTWNTIMASMVAGRTKCLQQIFQENNNHNSTIILKFADRHHNEYSNVNYNGTIWSTDSPGKLEFTIPDESPELQFPYWVLDTDYHNYAVTFICWSHVPIGRDYITVLGRSTSLSPESRAAVVAVLERTNLISDQMMMVPHTDCPSD